MAVSGFFPEFDDWDGFVASLNEVIDIEASARACGAFERPRKIANAKDLLRLAMLYGPCGLSLRSTSVWAASTGMADLSDVAILNRLRGAADWLGMMCQRLLDQRVEPALSARPCLALVDGTSVKGPGKTGGEWRLHCRYAPTGQFQEIEITDKHGGESLKRYEARPGDIVVGDRAYAKAGGLSHILDTGADFVVRTGWRSLPLRQQNGVMYDLFGALRDLEEGETADVEVVVRDGERQVPVRLIMQRKSGEARAREVKRVRRKRQKNCRSGDPRSLEAAGFIMIVTSLDAEAYDAATVLSLYRMRWQIELAFKRLKSLIHIDRLPAKDERLTKAWLYSHLIFALVIETLSGEALASFPWADGQEAASSLDLAGAAIADRGSEADLHGQTA